MIGKLINCAVVVAAGTYGAKFYSDSLRKAKNEGTLGKNKLDTALTATFMVGCASMAINAVGTAVEIIKGK